MIRISRVNEYMDSVRSYKIMLDNGYVGDIKNGEVKDIDIEPGIHEIFLKIDWCRSNIIEFNVSANETVEFECGNSMDGMRILLSLVYITFLKNKYLWIKVKKRA
jgi:hypothetical protein